MLSKYPEHPTTIEAYLDALQSSGAFSNEDLLELEDHMREEEWQQSELGLERGEAEKRATELMGPVDKMIAHYRRKNIGLLLQEQLLLAISGMYYFIFFIPFWILGTYGFHFFLSNTGFGEAITEAGTLSMLVLLKVTFLLVSFQLYRRSKIVNQIYFRFIIKRLSIIGPSLCVFPFLYAIISEITLYLPSWQGFMQLIRPFVGVYYVGVLIVGLFSLVDYLIKASQKGVFWTVALNRLSFFVGGLVMWFVHFLVSFEVMKQLIDWFSQPPAWSGYVYSAILLIPVLLWWSLFNRKAKSGKLMVY